MTLECICDILRDPDPMPNNEGHKRMCPIGPYRAAALQRMSVLLLANSRAADLRHKAMHSTPEELRRGPYTIMHGAPSHSCAHLLNALEELGWTLTPIAKDQDHEQD